MDIPLAQNYIEILKGFKGYKRKSSTFNRKADVDELFALYGDANNLSSIGYFYNSPFINE